MPATRSSVRSAATPAARGPKDLPQGNGLGYRTLQEILSERLRAEILRGKPVPGSRLSITALARRFGVSPIPVREALRGLEAEGLVEFVANKGAAVKLLSHSELREMLLIRLPLERLALGEAIPRMSDADVDRLDATLALMANQSDVGRWLELNQRFHFETYLPADLPRLQTLITSLWAGTRPFVALTVTNPTRLSKWDKEHAELARAIRGRDIARALRILEQHSTDTRNAVLGRSSDSQVSSDVDALRSSPILLPSDVVITTAKRQAGAVPKRGRTEPRPSPKRSRPLR